MNEIIVFSHISGEVETIYCDDYRIYTGKVNVVVTINGGVECNVIPWNRVKQINIG